MYFVYALLRLQCYFEIQGKFMQNDISGHSFIIVLLSILKMYLYIPFKALHNLTDVKDKHNILISCK